MTTNKKTGHFKMIVIKSYTFAIIHVLKRRHLIDVSQTRTERECSPIVKNWICAVSIGNSFVCCAVLSTAC